MHDDSQLPVLNAVARRGNDSIISSTRLGHEVLDELEAMRRDCASRSDEGAPFARGEPSAIDFTGLTGGVVHLSAEVDDPVAPDGDGAPPIDAPCIGAERAASTDALVGPDDPTLEIDPMPALAAAARYDRSPGTAPADTPLEAPLASPALERRIDELVERHVQALRLELRHLLKGASSD